MCYTFANDEYFLSLTTNRVSKYVLACVPGIKFVVSPDPRPQVIKKLQIQAV